MIVVPQYLDAAVLPVPKEYISGYHLVYEELRTMRYSAFSFCS
jgi:hypothetical protein